MPILRAYRLFISHSWRYSERYMRMVEFLNAAPNFVWYNYSVPESKAYPAMRRAALEDELRDQIRPAQVVIILGGMYINHSDWLQFEIDFSKALRKPIIGIYPWGGQRMPLAVQSAASELVNWNTASIVSAVRRWAM